MVQIAVGWGGEFESAEADVVECFVVDAEVSSVFSTSWCTERVALYGSTTVSETFGAGTTE